MTSTSQDNRANLYPEITPKEEVETGNEISHFILDFIDEDLAPGGRSEGMRITHASLLNRMATSISDTQRPS